MLAERRRSAGDNIKLDNVTGWKVQRKIQGGRVIMRATSNNYDIAVANTNGYNGKEPTRECPKCGQTKPLSEFGWRNMGGGVIRNQSYCSKCR